MRMMSKAIVAGLATVVLAGSAVAAERAIHTMNVALPDGSIAKVRYVGEQPPQVRIVPVAVMQPMPIAMIDPSFAAFDRMFAAMDAQRDAMLRQASMMARMPAPTQGQLQHAAQTNIPGGTMSYSYVSTTSSGGCTQTVRMTSDGSGQQPQVIRTSAGKCDGAKAIPAVASPVAPAKPVIASETRPAPKPIDPNTI